MSWQDKVNRTSNRAKKPVANKDAKHFDGKKLVDNIGKGSVNAFKGIKNRALGKMKSYDAYKKVQEIITKMQKVATFITSNIKVIGIVSAIVAIIWNAAIFGISIVQSLGPTPHYYCEIDADKTMKKSAMYQQYCSKKKSGFELNNLNGHYFVQDGSGPCTCTSKLNLLLRYYARKEINLYDYAWDETGKYDFEKIQSDVKSDTNSDDTLRHFANGNIQEASDDYSTTNKYGSREFAAKNGIADYTMANWGYLRDESIDLTDVSVDDDNYSEYANTNNEAWVWDLQYENDASNGTTWKFAWSTKYEINGVKATFKYFQGQHWNNADELKQLLDEHPSGIYAYRKYGSDGNHAILITGYVDDVFYVVDPGLGMRGGFEGPATSSNFVLSMWSNDQIGTVGSNLNGFGYIEEDEPD